MPQESSLQGLLVKKKGRSTRGRIDEEFVENPEEVAC